MIKRLYYTCPIRALYMMKEFGVEFECQDEGYFYDFANWGLEPAQMIHELLEMFANDYPEKIYIKKESEHIFEQKKGDIALHKEDGWLAVAKALEYSHFEENNGTISPSKYWKIIKRDGKHFFYPEVEE